MYVYPVTYLLTSQAGTCDGCYSNVAITVVKSGWERYRNCNSIFLSCFKCSAL